MVLFDPENVLVPAVSSAMTGITQRARAGEAQFVRWLGRHPVKNNNKPGLSLVARDQ